MATDEWAPAWDLEINAGLKFPPEHRQLVRSIKVLADGDGCDELTIVADARDPDTRAWRFVGEALLAPGNRVTVFLGWGLELEAVQRFIIVEEHVSYGERGHPQVTIRGLSADRRLAAWEGARAWEGPIADSDIVRELADTHQLLVTGDSVADTPSRGASGKAARKKPRNTSDLTFLHQLAVANGYGSPFVRYDIETDSDVLYFRPLEAGDPLTFTYDPVEAGSDLTCGDCYSFEANLDLSGVASEVEVIGWDPDTQQPVAIVMKVEDAGQDPTVYEGADANAVAGYMVKSGAEMVVRVFSDGDEPEPKKRDAIHVPHVHTIDEATDYARRWIATRNQAFLTGRAKIKGNAAVWKGQVHEFVGIAPVHVGLWEVVRAEHTLDERGYVVDLDLARVLEDAAEPVEG